MAVMGYSDELKADAAALYESTPGATCTSIAADLGINRAILREWVLRDRERQEPGPEPLHRRFGRAGTRVRAVGWMVRAWDDRGVTGSGVKARVPEAINQRWAMPGWWRAGGQAGWFDVPVTTSTARRRWAAKRGRAALGSRARRAAASAWCSWGMQPR